MHSLVRLGTGGHGKHEEPCWWRARCKGNGDSLRAQRTVPSTSPISHKTFLLLVTTVRLPATTGRCHLNSDDSTLVTIHHVAYPPMARSSYQRSQQQLQQLWNSASSLPLMLCQRLISISYQYSHHGIWPAQRQLRYYSTTAYHMVSIQCPQYPLFAASISNVSRGFRES